MNFNISLVQLHEICSKYIANQLFNLKFIEMKREIVFTVFLALVTLGFFGCQKDDMGITGPSTLGVKIEALNKSYSLPVTSSANKSALAGTTSVEWDSAHLIVSNIKFEAELKSLITHRDSIEISFKWTGPQKANLLKPDIAFGNFILQPGFYDEIEITVKGEKQDAKDIPVFYLHGMFTGSTATLPIEVMVNEDVTFKTEKDSVEITEESIDITSYIQLYLDELMAKIDPADLDNSKLTDGVIVISKDSNRDIYYTIFNNLAKDRHCYYEHKHEKGKKKKNKNKGKDHDNENDNDD